MYSRSRKIVEWTGIVKDKKQPKLFATKNVGFVVLSKDENE